MFLSKVLPFEVCDHYTVGTEIECLYIARPEAVYFSAPEFCLMQSAVTAAVAIIFLVFPIAYLIVYMTIFCIRRMVVGRKHQKMNNDTLLVPIGEKWNDTSAIRGIKDETNIREVLGEYIEANKGNKKILGFYQWRNSSLFSIIGFLLFAFSLVMFFLSIAAVMVMGYALESRVSCLGDLWATNILPLLVSLSIGVSGWVLFVLGLIGLVLLWCWSMNSKRFLVAFDDEILLLKQHRLTGVVSLKNSLPIDSLHQVGQNSFFRFASTWKILFLLQFHPTVEITEDPQGASISIPVFYDDAQPILDWLSTTFPA